MTKVKTLHTYLGKSEASLVSTGCDDPTVPTQMFVQTKENH
jgi:hypothetical protein